MKRRGLVGEMRGRIYGYRGVRRGEMVRFLEGAICGSLFLLAVGSGRRSLDARFLGRRPGRTLLSSDLASFKALRSLHAWIRRLRVIGGIRRRGATSRVG